MNALIPPCNRPNLGNLAGSPRRSSRTTQGVSTTSQRSYQGHPGGLSRPPGGPGLCAQRASPKISTLARTGSQVMTSHPYNRTNDEADKLIIIKTLWSSLFTRCHAGQTTKENLQRKQHFAKPPSGGRLLARKVHKELLPIVLGAPREVFGCW